MIQNYVPAQYRTVIEYSKVFDDGTEMDLVFRVMKMEKCSTILIRMHSKTISGA